MHLKTLFVVVTLFTLFAIVCKFPRVLLHVLVKTLLRHILLTAPRASKLLCFLQIQCDVTFNALNEKLNQGWHELAQNSGNRAHPGRKSTQSSDLDICKLSHPQGNSVCDQSTLANASKLSSSGYIVIFLSYFFVYCSSANLLCDNRELISYQIFSWKR